nr:MAG TPA: hypothetical protein [Caudoviricetes sp.]
MFFDTQFFQSVHITTSIIFYRFKLKHQDNISNCVKMKLFCKSILTNASL